MTPFFVLFCNVIATSDPKDFYAIKSITDELEGLVELSISIAKLQTLFKSFIELCEGLVSEKRPRTVPLDVEVDLQTSRPQRTTPVVSQTSNYSPSPVVVANCDDPYSLLPPTSIPLVTQESGLALSSHETRGTLDPDWGLFDVQPTLEWLDADLSLFDNGNYW